MHHKLFALMIYHLVQLHGEHALHASQRMIPPLHSALLHSALLCSATIVTLKCVRFRCCTAVHLGLQFALTRHNIIIDVKNTLIWHTAMCLIMTLLCSALLLSALSATFVFLGSVETNRSG